MLDLKFWEENLCTQIKKKCKKKKKKRDRENTMWEDNTTFANWHFLFSVVNYSKNIVEDKKYSVILKIETSLIIITCSPESNYISLEMRSLFSHLILNLPVLRCSSVLELGAGI